MDLRRSFFAVHLGGGLRGGADGLAPGRPNHADPAATIHGQSLTDYPAPIFLAKRRWVEAMAGPGDHLAVETAAAAFEELGYPVHAADAWADAALMAARAGSPSEAEARARSLCESLGMHPLLGPLPETSWIDPDPREASATSA